jgi:hypothetical protein
MPTCSLAAWSYKRRRSQRLLVPLLPGLIGEGDLNAGAYSLLTGLITGGDLNDCLIPCCLVLLALEISTPACSLAAWSY